MRAGLRIPSLVAGTLAFAALGGPAAYAQEDAAFCPPPQAGLKCFAGDGLTSAGGGAKAPHNDGAGRKWPKVNGIFWQATDNKDRKQIASPDNDELLGHHGDERLSGAGGNDILWGDWDPKNNTTKQVDYLSGGSGNDWLYPSHGRNTILGGPGVDYVYAYYGKGTIDCGPGKDTARVRIGTGQYRVKNCETIKHFCAFGENSSGGCKKPGELSARRRAG